MTGLVLKDLLVARKTLKAYAGVLGIYLVLSAMGMFEFSFILGMVNIMVAMIPIGSFAYDEQAKWDRYALSLPLGRRKVVGARYLFVLLVMLLALAVGLLACVLTSLRDPQPLAESLATLLATAGFGLFILDITLPLNYKLGPERARPYFYAVCLIPLVLLFAAAKLELLKGLDVSWVEGLSDGAALGLFSLIPLTALAGLGVSYLISCRVMEGKEF